MSKSKIKRKPGQIPMAAPVHGKTTLPVDEDYTDVLEKVRQVNTGPAWIVALRHAWQSLDARIQRATEWFWPVLGQVVFGVIVGGMVTAIFWFVLHAIWVRM